MLEYCWGCSETIEIITRLALSLVLKITHSFISDDFSCVQGTESATAAEPDTSKKSPSSEGAALPPAPDYAKAMGE